MPALSTTNASKLSQMSLKREGLQQAIFYAVS
jgi:hypothetical protein